MRVIPIDSIQFTSTFCLLNPSHFLNPNCCSSCIPAAFEGVLSGPTDLSNPSSASSDGVPPKLVVLDLREALPGPVGTTGQTGSAQSFAGVDRSCVHSSILGILTRFCVNGATGKKIKRGKEKEEKLSLSLSLE